MIPHNEVGNRLTKTEGAQQTTYQYNTMNQLTLMNEGGVVTTFQCGENDNQITTQNNPIIEGRIWIKT